MILTDEHIQSGTLNVTPEQAAQAAAEVQAYNAQAEQNRIDYKRHISQIEDLYGFTNLIMTAALAIGTHRHRYPMPILSFTAVTYFLIFVHVIGVILLAVIRRDLVKSAVISCCLLAASWVYIPLVIINWVAVVIRDSADNRLRSQPGYPHFHAVHLHVEEQYSRPMPVQNDAEQPAAVQTVPEALHEEENQTEEMEDLI